MLSGPETLPSTSSPVVPAPVALTAPEMKILPVSGAFTEIAVEFSPTTVTGPLTRRSPINGASSATPNEFFPCTLMLEAADRVMVPVSDPGPMR